MERRTIFMSWKTQHNKDVSSPQKQFSEKIKWKESVYPISRLTI